MPAIGPIDQAILILKDRLQRLGGRAGQAAAGTSQSRSTQHTDGLRPLRQLAAQGQVTGEELRKALVRTLLADSLGGGVIANLEFQALCDRISRMLDDSETGKELLERALRELE
jgi:uncharacterized membrane protein YebE (DUF533 family)